MTVIIINAVFLLTSTLRNTICISQTNNIENFCILNVKSPILLLEFRHNWRIKVPPPILIAKVIIRALQISI